MTMINATFNETRKGLIILWDYRFSMLTEIFGIFMIVIGIMFFVGQGSITQEQVVSTSLGFIITFYAMNAISNMSWSLMQEAQAGTLEQMYMSPAPTPLIILGRSFASLASGTVEMFLVTVAVLLVFRTTLPLSWEMIPIFLITLVGLFGFGYIVGGITLVFKQVGPIANIIQNFLMIGNGTFLPIAMMPAWMASAVSLIPSTLGIVMLRRIGLEGASLTTLWADGSLAILIVHSVVFFILGWIIYKWCENIARKQGSLGQY